MNEDQENNAVLQEEAKALNVLLSDGKHHTLDELPSVIPTWIKQNFMSFVVNREAIKASFDFRESMLKIQKQSGMSQEAFRQLTQDIHKLDQNACYTQFSNFADSLWQDLEIYIRHQGNFIPEGRKMRPKFLDMVHAIISQHAYDFVRHVLVNVDPLYLDSLSVEEHAQRIPDIAESTN